jgi:hypothetical protein
MRINYNAYMKPVVTPRDVAKRFLVIRLVCEPVEATKLLRTAVIKGISPATLRRAKADLGIKARKDGPRTWRWHLPRLP